MAESQSSSFLNDDQSAAVDLLLRSVVRDRHEIAIRIVERIEREIPQYRPMPRPQFIELLSSEVPIMLTGIETNQAPNDSLLEGAYETGAQRAHHGVPLLPMIAAMNMCARLLWIEVLSRSEANSVAHRELLMLLMRGWSWVDAVVAESVKGHMDRTKTQEESAEARLLSIVEQLGEGQSNARTSLDSRMLGLDPDSGFVTASLHLAGYARIDTKLSAVLPPGCVVLSTPFNGSALVVIQGAEPFEVVAALESCLPTWPSSVSSLHRSLDGLTRCIAESQRLLPLAKIRRRTLSYDEHWLTAILLEDQKRLPDGLELGARVAEDNPHLADAVRSFGESGFSITACARNLQVHVNTVRYRLERWEELTSWDPHTFEGLTQSIAAIALART